MNADGCANIKLTRRRALNAGIAALAAACPAWPMAQQQIRAGSGKVTTDDPPFYTGVHGIERRLAGADYEPDGCANFKLTRRRALNAGIAALAAACPAWPFAQQQIRAGSGKTTTDDPPFKTPAEPPNTPMGVGKGIHPGRVAWAHEPKVATWDGKTGNWWDDASTDPRLVDAMLSGDLRSLTGERTDKEAWRALFEILQPDPKAGRRRDTGRARRSPSR